MISAADLKTQTVKDLSELAKKLGLKGWHSMRKDELVKALVRANRSKKGKSRSKKKAPTVAKSPSRVVSRAKPAAQKSRTQKNNRVIGKIRKINAERKRLKDLSAIGKMKYASPKPKSNGKKKKPLTNGRGIEKDRVVLLVRDAYWLQACWDVTRQSVQRARAAMAEHWHTARPVLRVMEVDAGNTTNTTERVARDIEIHGGVKNWYIEVESPPRSYRADLGYLADNGRFYALARSNAVTTPMPGASDSLDENWTDVAENADKIYALSGGYNEEVNGDLQELFEERLRRPMGSPVVTRFGVGANETITKQREFVFEVDAEMIIYGQSKSDAHVTLAGEPVRLRPDGSFTVRLSMPDRRQVLPVVAASSDGVEQRTIVLAVERNTKVMEPMIRDHNE